MSWQWLRLRWPREVPLEAALAALLALNGLSTPRRREALLLRASGTADGVIHHLAVNETRLTAVQRQLHTAVPGLSTGEDEAPDLVPDRLWRLWVSTNRRPLNVLDVEAAAGAVLTALQGVEDDEAVVVQWLLGPVRRPQAVPDQMPGSHSGPLWSTAIAAPFVAPGELDRERRSALRTKQALPGWRASLRIAVRAEGVRRQRQLLGRLAAAMRLAQAPGVEVGFRPSLRPSRFDRPAVPLLWPVAINVAELRGLVGWPLGRTDHLAVERVTSRLLPPPRGLAQRGRVVAMATHPGQERPLALNPPDALQHLHVLGPTGVGKSTLLLNLIVADMAAGRGVVVVEPKGDLVADVLARVPRGREDDIVVLDPNDDCPVGVNPLANRQSPELVVDQVLAVFRGLFGDAIGPRTQDVLTAGLLTLTYAPGASVAALPLLFTDDGVRHRLVTHAGDNDVLRGFWQWFEALSAAERSAVLAPLMNKLRHFLLRERLRRVIGQPHPRFVMGQVFSERRIALVNLATGLLGPEAAGLLGALIVSQLWQAALARSAVAPERRHPVFVYVDEFQNYLHLPTDLGDALAASRSYGVGWTVAHQHLGQLSATVRAAVLANARSRVLFQMNHEDASVLVRGDDRLVPADLGGLGRFEVYASLVSGGQATPYASARTLPPPPAQGPADDIRQRSRRQWGVPASEVDRALAELARPEASRPSDDGNGGFGRRRRGGRS